MNVSLISTKRKLYQLRRQHFTWFCKKQLCPRGEREKESTCGIYKDTSIWALRITKKYLKYFSKYSRSQYTRACFRKRQECNGEGRIGTTHLLTSVRKTKQHSTSHTDFTQFVYNSLTEIHEAKQRWNSHSVYFEK